MPPQQFTPGTRISPTGDVFQPGTRIAPDGTVMDAAPAAPSATTAPPPQKTLTPAEQRQQRFIQAQQGKVTPEPLSSLTAWLPAAGGAAGGVIGAPLGPAGAAAGAALGGMAGQSARRNIDAMTGATKPGTLAQEVGSVVGRGAAEGVASGVGSIAAPLMKWSGQKLVTSALKPAYHAVEKAIKNEEMPRVVKTLIDEGVNVSRGGIAKLNQVLNATNDEIKKALQGARGLIDPAKAARRLTDVEQTFVKQINPQDDLAAISGVGNKFQAHPMASQPGQIGTEEVATGILDPSGKMVTREQAVMGRVPKPLTVPEAHDLKVGEYKQLQNKAYTGELKSAEVEGRKAVARGLKEEIEAEVAKEGIDIRAMNRREGSVIEAKDAIARRVAAADNRDAAGLAWIAANPYTFMAFLMDRSPAIKSMVGRGLYKSAARAGRVSEDTIRLAIRAIATTPDAKDEK